MGLFKKLDTSWTALGQKLLSFSQHNKPDSKANDGRNQGNKKNYSCNPDWFSDNFPKTVYQEEKGIYAYHRGNNVIKGKSLKLEVEEPG